MDSRTRHRGQIQPSRTSWTRPLLVVLVRDRSSEHVLGTCKTAEEWPSSGPQDGYSACYRTGYCYEPGCEDLVMS